jgi:DNA-binding XRE family transcriptional regulator
MLGMPTLATVRRQRLMTQRELAQKAGVAPSTIFVTEKGLSTPSIATMRRICTALGVDDPMEINEFRAAIERGEAPEGDGAEPGS